MSSLAQHRNDDHHCHLVVDLDTHVTPSRFLAAFPKERASTFVLCGGVSEDERLDRFSFMGAEPIATLRAVRDGLSSCVVRIANEREIRVFHKDPFDALRDFLADHALQTCVTDETSTPYPFPLRAGAIGYIGYECGQLLERMPCLKRPKPDGMPDMAFAIHRWVVATSLRAKKSWLSIVGRGASADLAAIDAKTIRDHVMKSLLQVKSDPENATPSRPRAEAQTPRAVEIHATLSPDEYMARILVAKARITAGDVYEVCLTKALRTPFDRKDAWAFFHDLRRANPAPFAAMLDLPEGAIVSSSPERFLSLDAATRIAESRPIKGTRPRGNTPEEDERLRQELATSEKDRAENAMIVDLVRNDLGRVCSFGSIDVPELYKVEPYSTVHQLVSTVRGELKEDKDAIDLIRACFPPGSMTGAPKIEAMRILEKLEPTERGVYSGALGWIELGGSAMDLSVVIRTAIITNDNVATFSVGGAIVADSNPQLEHEETQHKARALVAALRSIDPADVPLATTVVTVATVNDGDNGNDNASSSS